MEKQQYVAKLPSGAGTLKYHLVALVTAIIWSTTFVSTKTLLNHGLTPENIFLYRFAIAYLGLLAFSRNRMFANSRKDEFLLFIAGLTGGSLYFITENTALEYTYASNVSILITTTPLFTLAISAMVFRHKLKKSMFLGSVIALGGVVLVVLNGTTSVNIAPVGDMLTIFAAVCWAAYSVIMKYLGDRDYPTLFMTRKVFFYGLVSILFYIPFSDFSLDLRTLTHSAVYGNILFLGVIASLVCFAVFNRVVEVIGPDKASNYIYLSPLGTMTTAVLFLNEPVTWTAVLGAAITIAGVVIVEKTS